MRLKLATGLALLSIVSGCLFATQYPSTLRDNMYAHFGDVGQVQTAVIEGNLERAKTAAARVESYSMDPGLPSTVAPYFQRLKEAAGVVARAETLDRAARGTAEMATACGSCHAELDRETPFSLRTTPPPAAPAAGHMLRHLWGADRLWEGLMGPSDELWSIGALALADAPMGFEMSAGSDVLRSLAQAVHDVGGSAEQALGPGDRAELYGRLLVTCADCHTLLGVN